MSKILAAEFADIPDSEPAARPGGTAVRAAPRPEGGSAASPPVSGKDGTFPSVVFSVQTLEPINLLGRDSARRYKARLTTPIASQGRVLVPVGAEVLLKVEYRESGDAAAKQYHAAITAVSIAVDGTPVAVSTRERLLPVPGPGGRYQGRSALPAGTPLQLVIGTAR